MEVFLAGCQDGVLVCRWTGTQGGKVRQEKGGE